MPDIAPAPPIASTNLLLITSLGPVGIIDFLQMRRLRV